MQKIYFILIVALSLTGCSTYQKISNREEDTSNTRRIFDDRAPASLTPPHYQTETTLVDPLYLHTQADYHFTLAEAQALSGQPDKAIEEYKLALVYDPDSASIRFRLSGEYVKKGMISEALEQNETVISKNPEFKDSRLLLGTLYTALKMYDKAEAQYLYILKTDPEHTEANLYYGAVLAERGSAGKAISHFEQYAKMAPDNKTKALAYYYIGRVYITQKSYVKSVGAFEQALSIYPKMADAVLALGAVWEETSKRDKAVELYANFQDKFGPDVKVAKVLGHLYMEDEKFDLAYRQYEIMESEDSDNLNIKVKMALVLIEKKDYPRAVTKLKEILAQAPDSDKIRFYLAAVYEEVKAVDQAITEFNKIPVSSTFYAEAMVHAAYLYKQKGDLVAASELMQTSIEARPEVPQFYALYASLLEDQKEFSKAVKMLEGATSRFADNEQLHFFLGFMYDKVGEREKTVITMNKVLGMNADHVQALNYLAYTYAELGRDLKKAEEMARHALKLKPDDGFITDTLGWVLFKQEKYDDSIKHLEIANKLVPNESIIAEHLGDAYYRYQMPMKAKLMYQKAVDLERDPVTVQKIQAKLEAVKAGVATGETQQTVRKPSSEEADQK